jgi:hypothetical protein
VRRRHVGSQKARGSIKGSGFTEGTWVCRRHVGPQKARGSIEGTWVCRRHVGLPTSNRVLPKLVTSGVGADGILVWSCPLGRVHIEHRGLSDHLCTRQQQHNNTLLHTVVNANMHLPLSHICHFHTYEAVRYTTLSVCPLGRSSAALAIGCGLLAYRLLHWPVYVPSCLHNCVGS